MRRPSFYVLTSVSLAALMALATVTEAMQPAVQMLGVLKPKEQWKVGTVDASGAPYCAMVGKFDQASTLAFARSPDGFGSLGIEFHDDLFKTGKKYEVSLALENLAPRTFSGEASTARSLVLQIGEDDALYESLSRSDTLRVTTSAIDVRFGIDKFQTHYKKLLTCANVLAGPPEQIELPANEMAKAQVPDGQGKLLAPIRNILQKLKAKPADAETAATDNTASPLQYAEKDIVWNDEKTAPAKTAAAGKKKSDAETAAVTLPLPKPSARAATTAAAEIVNMPPERKLLASMAVTGHAVTAESVGMDAREMEKIQAAKLERDMARKQKEIAALAVQTTEAARQQVEESGRRQDAMMVQAKDLQQQIAALEKAAAASAQVAAKTVEGPAVAAAPVTGVSAEVVAEPQKIADARAAKQRAEELAKKQAEMEKLNAAREAEARQLAETLSNTESAFSARVAAIETERDILKKQLDQALLFNNAVEPALETAKREGALKITALEAQLGDAEKARGQLRTELAKAEESNKALQESLKAQQEERQRADDAVRQIALLQAELEERARQAQVLELALATEKAKPPVTVEVPVEVAVEVPATPDPKLAEEKARLESRLSSVEAERKAEAERIAKLEQERSAEAERLAKLEQERRAEAERVAKLEQERKAEAERIAKLEQERASETRRTAELKAEREAARLQAEQEISRLREEKAALEQKLAARADAAVAQAPTRKLQPVNTYAVDTVRAVPPAPVLNTARLAAIETAAGSNESVDVFPAPAVSMSPARASGSATPRQITSQVSSGSNRAEAFLDNIMQHHRPQGAAAPAAKPVMQNAPYRPAAAPVVAAPAAPKPVAVATPALRNVPAAQPGMSARAVTLETLLEQSGVRGAVFQPVQQSGGELSRQWSVGRLSGLYEQMPARGASFDAQAHDYIARYQEDCPGQLSVKLGNSEQTPAGMVAAGTLSCKMPDNSYDTSMVFVQSGAHFAALLHSGNPSDAAQVKSLGDNIFYALSSSAGLSPLPSMASAPVPAAPVAPARRTVMSPAVMSPEPPTTATPRFNIGSAPAAGADEFETVVIQ
ncbi:MAG: hypothetical protein Q8K65_05260 [Alphaproteobacteria bacterium]|nr:hypothetical protein [Alphaproteobacteria bacterium]